MLKISHYNVLLAEDEPLLIRSLERHIEKLDMGFKVVCKACNGKIALELLQNNDIHLIISDIIMPVMTGLELLEQVNLRFPNVCVAILSGHADFSFAQNALRLNALDYILKPVTQNKIESILLKAKLKLGTHYQLLEDESLIGQSAQQAMEYARSYLREHFAEQIDLSVLSKELGFSSAYLTKLFNKYEHCTPSKYLTDLRIAEAKNLLYNTHLSIKDVGEKVGYDNQFYFSRVFRKYVNLTPSEYRQRS